MEINVVWLSIGAGLTLVAWSVLARAAGRRLQQKYEQMERQRTELAAQALNLQAARDEAERANRAKSQFLANVSHEIRTPMSAILGYVDLVLEEMELHGADADRWRQPLATVRSNGHHLMEIINDILDISKIEAGKLAVELVDCPVGQLATDVATLLRHRAESKGLVLEVRYRTPIPAVIQSDPTRVRQILLNLVGNAIKFTECGQVSVELELQADGNTAPQLLVDVMDTGIGMSPQHLAVIFQPFVQGDSSATRKYEGTGLGLSISQRLAELLGGTIAAESALGQGSRFRLTLPAGSLEGVPLVDQPASVEPVPPLPPRVDLQLNCHVLLAEDGPDNQRLIAMLLRKAGANVTIVDNGQLAVELALRAKSGKLRRRDDPGGGFDVILMDMQMPVLDGCQATRQLRDAGYEAPIIALTANAMAQDREQCFEAGCDDFSTKPIDRVTLLSTVARWAEFNAARITDTVLVAPRGEAREVGR